jgi:hypothetical protein
MNVESATMTLPRGQAREHYKNYRAAVKADKATRDDLMLYRAYRALVRGQKLIDINAAIGVGGIDAHGRPRLAICRADAAQVFLNVWGDGAHFASSQFRHRPATDVTVPATAFLARPGIGATGQAALPSIPPQYRPDPATLADHHLLWEAEWRPVPPGDPMLLKHVDGPFYVVLAAWDMTPLEQAVMRLRL